MILYYNEYKTYARGGALSANVIMVGIGVGDPSSNPGYSCLNFTSPSYL